LGQDCSGGEPDLKICTRLARVAERDQQVAAIAALVGGGLLIFRAPFAIRNFYAEDGARFFQDALDSGLLESFRHPLAGYYHFVPRSIGFLVTLVPVSAMALVNFVLVVLVVGWASSTIYLSSGSTLRNPLSRLSLAVGVTLLPIVGFESIANSANLHFILLCAVAVILVGEQRTRWQETNGTLLAVLSGLTTPLTIALVPLAVFRVWRDRRMANSRLSAVVVGWALGTATQLCLILFFARGSRSLGEGRSVQRTAFLLLDRVFGYNFIPFWPSIRGDSYSGSASAQLVSRAVFCGVLAVLLGLLLLRAGRAGIRSGEHLRVMVTALVLCVGVGFWLAAGLLFSTEPRYAVFPAFCILWALLVASELMAATGLRGRFMRFNLLSMGVGLLLVTAVASHWQPSELRRVGPNWSDGVRAAGIECASTGGSTASIRVLPMTDDWRVELPCELLSQEG
jgi:hypothetical protein